MPLRDDQSSDYSDDTDTQGSTEGLTDEEGGESPRTTRREQPRGEHGHFASPDDVDEEELEDDLEEEEDLEEEDDDADIPLEEEDEGLTEGVESQAGAETEEGAGTGKEEIAPLTFRAGGQDFQINGSYLTKDGHGVIPKDHLEEVMRLVSLGQHHQSSYREELGRRDSRIRDLESQLQTKSQAEEEAQHVLDFFAGLRQKGRQAAIEWFDNLDQNWAVLEADARAAAAESRAKALEQRQNQARAVDEGREWESYQQDTLEKAIYHEVERGFANLGLTDDDLAPLYRTLYHTRNSIIYRADKDLYVGGQLVAKKGQVVIDYLPIREGLGLLAQNRQAARQGADQAAQAVRQNARRRGVRTPPPVVRANRTTEGQRRQARKINPRNLTREQAERLAFNTPVDVANAMLRGDER